MTYDNKKVKKCFLDYKRMQQKLPIEWVRKIKKHVDRLEAAACFGDFLKLGLGKPEQLSGYEQIHYSLHVSPNVRMVFVLEATQETVMACTQIIIKGVCDYHGDKENWYIP